MTQEEMNNFIVIKHPITYNSVRVNYLNGNYEIGYFLNNDEDLISKNKWRFVLDKFASQYRENYSKEFTKVINGLDVKDLILL
jgi:hypothetical protein